MPLTHDSATHWNRRSLPCLLAFVPEKGGKAVAMLAALLCVLTLTLAAAPPPGAQSFYVDPARGDDTNGGSVDRPFRTLSRALAVVDARVKQGIRADKIFLRAGVYRNDTTATKWRLNLRGTPDDYAMISAMPAGPNTPGAVQRKAGQWYENVVFDDAQTITTRWTPVPDRPNLWQTRPGFVMLEWTHQNLWPWVGPHLKITDRDSTPLTTSFTVAPYMLLQDGAPMLWADMLAELTEPGYRTYDQATGTLYVRPFGDKDPNGSKFESWYGGDEKNGELLLLDGEGRAFFDGDMQYAAIRGCEFRMFTRIFEFHRLKYESESERAVQRNVLFEDNLCRYGWMHILLDGNTVFARENGLILPRYADRSDWHVRNNVFYRPAREVFQVHGDNHIFEHNDVIEHGGPWAGPAAVVSILNARNSRNIRVRHNYIEGHGDNRWHGGSVFMIEVEKGHADASGDCHYGGQTYEYNLFANVTSGSTLFLGKGDCRLTNITVRGNIFTGHRGGPTIRLTSPHANLRIEDNIFHAQQTAIGIAETFHKHPSTITIRNNIFANSKTAIDPRLPAPGISIDRNQFSGNAPAGENPILSDPEFRDPSRFDFRSAAAAKAGPYARPEQSRTVTEWWRGKAAR